MKLALSKFLAIIACIIPFSVFGGSINNGIVFGSMYVTGTGTFNNNVTPCPVLGTVPQLVVCTVDGTAGQIQFFSFGAPNLWNGLRADGTNALPSALVSGDSISTWQGAGYDGTGYSNSAGGINLAAAENWSNVAHGTNLNFNYTSSGTTGVTTGMQILTSSHIVFDNGPTGKKPTISACGTSPVMAGVVSDNEMQIQVGTGGVATSCVINFGVTWENSRIPTCVANSDTDKVGLSVLATTTTLTISAAAAFTASSHLNVICIGRN